MPYAVRWAQWAGAQHTEEAKAASAGSSEGCVWGRRGDSVPLWWVLNCVNAGAITDPTQRWEYWPGGVSNEILAKGALFFPRQSGGGEFRSSGRRQALSGPGDTQPPPTLGME